MFQYTNFIFSTSEFHRFLKLGGRSIKTQNYNDFLCYYAHIRAQESWKLVNMRLSQIREQRRHVCSRFALSLRFTMDHRLPGRFLPHFTHYTFVPLRKVILNAFVYIILPPHRYCRVRTKVCPNDCHPTLLPCTYLNFNGLPLDFQCGICLAY